MAIDSADLLRWGSEVLTIEARAISEVSTALDEQFAAACRAILACKGRLVVSGMGKSGHIGRKMAATFASTGTPAFFMHPAEAAHGDLGMIVDGDVVLALSNSGESDEIAMILPALRHKDVCLIAITSREESTLAQNADIHLLAAVSQEACPLGLAPTSSTTATLALGDALAVALLQARSFTSEDFAFSHPAGSLGRRLLLKVADVMHTGEDIPQVALEADLREVVLCMSEKGLGMVAIVDDAGYLKGVFTDGDLRRLFQSNRSLNDLCAADVMQQKPKTIMAERLAVDALHMMEEAQINSLLVVSQEGQVVGALNTHDLLQARII